MHNAYTNGRQSNEGLINLPLTAFYYFTRGDASVTDPPIGQIQGSTQFYNFMQGRVGLTGQPFIDPTTGMETKFALNGDPLTGEGWIDGILQPTGDRRIGLSSGPFQMAVGDTQEVVFSELAGVGIDNKNPIRLLRFYSILSKDIYDNSFDITHAPFPLKPNANISQQDKYIIINWPGTYSLEHSANKKNNGDFSFQGYNIYQLHSDLALKSNAKRIETYDIIDGVTEIEGLVMNPQTGYPELGIQQYGSDSGIQNSITITTDIIDDTYFIPGKKYYFGVSSYSYNPDPTANPNNSESLIDRLEITFQDTSAPAIYGDSVEVQHINGIAGGIVTAIVVDPFQLTNHLYKVYFDTTASGELVWNVKDSTLNVIVLENQTNFSGGYDSPIVDGLQIQVITAAGFTNFEVVANANGLLDPPSGGALDFAGFPSERPDDRQQVGEGHWAFHTADNGGSDEGGGTRGQYDAFLNRVTRSGGNWLEILPYAFEMRFTGSSIAYDAFDTVVGEDYVPVPFELWNIGFNTPDDPSDDYRMVPFILSNSNGDFTGNASYELESWGLPSSPGGTGGGQEHSASSSDNDPYTDWIYWYRPEDTSPGESGYLAAEAEMNAGTYDGQNETEVIARTVLINWNGGSAPAFNQGLPETGTIFRITSASPFVPGVDEYLIISDFNISNVGDDSQLPYTYQLHQNYPNPFNPSTIIKFTMPEQGLVKLNVYDILGQKVAMLINSQMKAGKYEIEFDGRNLASGVYFYRLQAGDFVETKKMILLK
jgi:hypothetical protein